VAAAADSGVTWLLEGFDPGVTVADFEAVVTAGPVPVRLAVREKTRRSTVDRRVVV
jgi:hypothetical protein